MAEKLTLTSTPNVAQVIRIVAQMQYQDRWHRRLRRWLFPPKTDEVDATVMSIESAATARKRFDASGNVVVEPQPDLRRELRYDGRDLPAARVRTLFENEGGKHIAIDGLAERPKIGDL